MEELNKITKREIEKLIASFAEDVRVSLRPKGVIQNINSLMQFLSFMIFFKIFSIVPIILSAIDFQLNY